MKSFGLSAHAVNNCAGVGITAGAGQGDKIKGNWTLAMFDGAVPTDFNVDGSMENILRLVQNSKAINYVKGSVGGYGKQSTVNFHDNGCVKPAEQPFLVPANKLPYVHRVFNPAADKSSQRGDYWCYPIKWVYIPQTTYDTGAATQNPYDAYDVPYPSRLPGQSSYANLSYFSAYQAIAMSLYHYDYFAYSRNKLFSMSLTANDNRTLYYTLDLGQVRQIDSMLVRLGAGNLAIYKYGVQYWNENTNQWELAYDNTSVSTSAEPVNDYHALHFNQIEARFIRVLKTSATGTATYMYFGHMVPCLRTKPDAGQFTTHNLTWGVLLPASFLTSGNTPGSSSDFLNYTDIVAMMNDTVFPTKDSAKHPVFLVTLGTPDSDADFKLNKTYFDYETDGFELPVVVGGQLRFEENV